jgi:hypothetical protein
MSFWRVNTRGFAVLIVLAILNVSMSITTTASTASSEGVRRHFPAAFRERMRVLNAGADKSFNYGLDKDKVPFALKADGVKGRFFDVSPNHFKLQIVKAENLGEVEFIRMTGGESVLRFTPPSGNTLFVRTKNLDEGVERAPHVAIGFQFKDSRIVLTVDTANSRAPIAPKEAEKLYRMMEGLQGNRQLKELMEEARIFAGRPVLSGVMATMLANYALVDSLDCLEAAGECLLMIGTYLASVGGLIVLCPETVGAGCIGALLLHPVIGLVVAVKCTKATRACGLVKPPPPATPPPPCPNTDSFSDPFADPYGSGYAGFGYGDPYGSSWTGDPFSNIDNIAPILDMWGWSWLNPTCDPFGGYLDYVYY